MKKKLKKFLKSYVENWVKMYEPCIKAGINPFI